MPEYENVEAVRERFTYQPPSNSQVAAMHAQVSQMTGDLAVHFASKIPKSRELSLGLTALAEARMWLNAAVAVNQVEVDS